MMVILMYLTSMGALGSVQGPDGTDVHRSLPAGAKVIGQYRGTPVEVSHWRIGFERGRASV